MTDSEFFESFRERAEAGLRLWDSPSVAVGVIKDGEIVLCDGFGRRSVEEDLPATRDTLYQIGSCTKAFTAALAAIMVDQGKLEWDTPIVKYVPHIRFHDAFTSANVTLRDLLCHRTGMPRHELAWYGTDFTREELLHNLRYLEPNRTFRTGFQYSNQCYILAGHIVEQVTGKSYEQCLDEYIFRPLGMDRSSVFIDDIESDADHAVPCGRPDPANALHGISQIPFYRSSVEDKAAGIGTPLAPAGCINSCAADMLKWVRLHLNRGKWQDQQIISEAAMAEMHKPNMILTEPLDMPMPETELCCYGLGWFVEKFRGHKIVQHGGNINGFSGFTAFVPDLDLGVVAYTNMNSSFLHYALGREIVDHYLGVEDGNWVQRYHDYVAMRSSALPKLIKRFVGEQVPGTSPSHALADYTGDFRHPGYSPMAVTLEDDTLYLSFVGEKVKMRHYHYDTFVLDGTLGELPAGAPLHFHTAEVGGQVDALSMPLVTEPGGRLIRFGRQQSAGRE